MEKATKKYQVLRPIVKDGITITDGMVDLEEESGQRLCNRGYVCALKELKETFKTKELKTKLKTKSGGKKI